MWHTIGTPIKTVQLAICNGKRDQSSSMSDQTDLLVCGVEMFWISIVGPSCKLSNYQLSNCQH